MLPRTLTATQAQQLLARGRARQQSPECLTTPRAIYYWNDATQQYEREADFRPVAPAPLSSAAAPPASRPAQVGYWVAGALFLSVVLAPLTLLLLPVVVLILPSLFVVLLIAAGVFLGGWALHWLLSERR